MENRPLLKAVGFFLLYLLTMMLASCGPVVYTSRPGPPPPPWFYPNRLEVVRYIYFPDLRVYFDLRTHAYLYLEGNAWTRNPQLPPRYRNYDLSRQRFDRIRSYDHDDIKPYDDQLRRNSGRSNRTRDGGRVHE